MQNLKRQDPEIHSLIREELERQRNVIELIASENIVSKAVLEATGSWLTNKYSEGMPGKRYYGGNEHIDKAENLARERAKELFGAEHANVQPHSGSQANAAAYFAVLKPGDTILGMDLAHGGHLTHGSRVNFSGRFYNFIAYGVDEKDHRIDMETVRKLAKEHRPRLILVGYSAYPRKIDFAQFKNIAEETGAYLMADMAHFAGLVAAKQYPDPVPYADIVTTTTHKTLRGPRGAMILCKQKDRLDPDGKKDLAQKIDSAVFPGNQGGPLDHVVSAKAVAFKEAMQPEFAEYQRQVIKNAKVLADELILRGYRLVSGGTDNHLIMIDVNAKGISGRKAETALDNAHICTNKNMIPFDTRSPFNPSGIRIGTPAVTTRGMKEEEMKQIAEWVDKVLSDVDNKMVQQQVKQEVIEFCKKFPIYPGL